MNAIAAVYAVFGSDEEARRIGRDMVERRLAACVNVIGQCHSIYRWQDAVEAADEIVTIFKTRADTASALIAAIRAAHSYEVPAITLLPIVDSDGDYRDWVLANSGGEID